MIQSNLAVNGLHVAVIMDGNGRWAQARGMPRNLGHRAGVTAEAPRTRDAFARLLSPMSDATAPEVDLVIRTGGEQRLSDFLLWERAYAELYFTAVAWPDFDAQALGDALAEFGRRQRRFGGLPEQDAVAAVAS